MTEDMDESESIDMPVRVFLENYTYIGRDAAGYHHHADHKHARIIVCDDDGERVGDRGWYVQLDPDVVDHVHEDSGFKFAYGLELWADHVAEVRGWASRDLETAPAMREQFLQGGTL